MKYSKSSVFLKCLRKIGQGNSFIVEKLISIYLNSLTHSLIVKAAALIRIVFQFSIFGRLTEINEGSGCFPTPHPQDPERSEGDEESDGSLRDFFKTSKVIEALLSLIYNLKNMAVRLSVTSNCATSTKNLRQVIFLSPLKVGGIIIIAMLMTNLMLSIILQRQITLWGWLIRALFLFIGICGLFCNADWQSLKKDSLILRKIR